MAAGVETERAGVIAALDDAVADVMRSAGLAAPPVDAIAIARRLGIVVAVDRDQPVRGRHKRLAGMSTIFLRPDDRPERRQWAVAHELGEVQACRIYSQAGFEDDSPPAGMREEIANLFAARLLLPSDWFYRDVESVGGDLLELKQRYRTASHELIAMRLLDLPQPSIVTVFDQGSITRRRSNSAYRTPPLTPAERQCWTRVNANNRPYKHVDDRLEIHGWPIHEVAWKREILRTIVRDESQDPWEMFE